MKSATSGFQNCTDNNRYLMERCAGLIENAVFQTLDHAYWEEIGVDGNQILIESEELL